MAFGGDFNRDEIISEINMTPLVDVMLVLLIIFIITVPVLTHSIKIDLPQAQIKQNENKIKPESIVLSITDDAKVYWNDNLVNQNELEQRLSVAANQLPQPELQLRGARHVEYEKVVAVMSAAQQAGIQKLGFVTRL
jgi:biopolymer transport protein ExbD